MNTRYSFVAMLLVAALATPAAPATADTLPVVARNDVRAALLARGVELNEVDARVQSLTDEEAVLLAEKIDELPAGGNRAAALPAVVLAAFVIYYFWPVIVVAGVVTIVRAVAGPGTPANDETALATANHERVEGGWKRD
jgi:hypothetical protein